MALTITKCRRCGRGFKGKPYDRLAQAFTCWRIKCQKESGIYDREAMHKRIKSNMQEALNRLGM